eukprot:Transcript_9545.p3 GENE.Transcript_9545~~Transcript_9545.p3  ORF type:complete len:91 (+),score=3.29 Transcript_9545:1487-1759(+)
MPAAAFGIVMWARCEAALSEIMRALKDTFRCKASLALKSSDPTRPCSRRATRVEAQRRKRSCWSAAHRAAIWAKLRAVPVTQRRRWDPMC